MHRSIFASSPALTVAPDLTPKDIAEVVLVGGSTRIPYVRKLLKGFFGKKKVGVRCDWLRVDRRAL